MSDDHSSAAVLICRCIPLIRSLVSIPAGFRRMNPVTFTLFTAVGSLMWNTLLVGAGFLLGDNWGVVTAYVGVLRYVVMAVIAAVVGWWVWTRFISKSHRARREQEERELAAAKPAADYILDGAD